MKKGSTERKKILIDWNNTDSPYPKDKTIYQLFEEQVNKTPNNIAIVFEDKKLSYKNLNKKSNQLAHLIRAKYKAQNKKDLKPDSLIGLCVARSLDMIIGILGILKAGGAYVPLDPGYPQDRLEYMIEDSHEGLIITQKDIVAKDGFLDKLHHDELLVIDSDEVKLNLEKQNDTNLDKISKPNNLAYVIYTSGSTGIPKGTMLEQASVINCLFWLQKEYGLTDKDKILQKTPISFDVSVSEYLWSLLFGATLVIAKPDGHKDPEYLAQLIGEHKVTFTHFVPSLLKVLIDLANTDKQIRNNLSSLNKIFCAGEALNIEIVRSCSNLLQVELFNIYGPTEAAIFATHYKCQLDVLEQMNLVPIGKGVDNAQMYILDNNLNPCPIGAPGELYIGGAGLARGYLNQEELTKERFIQNPFAKELGLSKSDRIYKTGDLVRWLSDGNIEYLGRTDFQVKIRGFRVELGEIENVLAKHKAISQVTVIAKEKGSQKYLAAFYVIAKNKKEPEIDELRSYLSETLPDYMVPAAFVKLDEMPLTPNGKINRRALPEPDMSLMGEEYVAPRNDIEEKLAEIWSDLLELEKVGINDDFFRIGGDSIKSIQIVSKMRRAGLDTSVKNFFDNLTIKKMSDYLSKQKKVEIKVIKPEQGLLTGEFDLLPTQKSYLYKHATKRVLIKLDKLDFDKLCKIIPDLISQHDILRASFVNKKGVWKQKYNKKTNTPEIKKLDISKLKNKDELNEILTKWQSDFNIETGPLWQIGYLHGYQDNSARIFIGFHRAIIDDKSSEILIKDIKSLYKGESLGEKSCSYRQWVDAINKYPKTHSKERAYWKYVNKRQAEFAKSISFSKKRQQCEFYLSKKITKKLLTVANKAYHTEANDLLLCALAYALKDWSKGDVNYINLEGHCRIDARMGIKCDNTIGNFIYKYPMELKLLQDYRASIQYIKESLRDVPNQGLGYEACGYKSNNNINYNFLGTLENNELIDIDKNSPNDLSYKLNIKSFISTISDSDSSLGFIINAFADKTDFDKFTTNLEHYINDLIKHCCARVKKGKIIKTYSELDDYIQYEVINESAKNLPIVFFPPIAGGFETYIRVGFMDQLKDLQLLLFNPHYADFYRKTDKHFLYKETKIEERVANYILKLKKLYPEGPYCLCGFSLGGSLAFDVAKELVKQGDKISKLIMIDSSPSKEWINKYKKDNKIKLNIDEIILCKFTKVDDLIKVHKEDLIKHIKSNIASPSMYYNFLKLIIMGTFHRGYRNKILYFLSPKLTPKQWKITREKYNNWDKVLSNKIKVLKYDAAHDPKSWKATTVASDVSLAILSIKNLKRLK